MCKRNDNFHDFLTKKCKKKWWLHTTFKMPSEHDWVSNWAWSLLDLIQRHWKCESPWESRNSLRTLRPGSCGRQTQRESVALYLSLSFQNGIINWVELSWAEAGTALSWSAEQCRLKTKVLLWWICGKFLCQKWQPFNE